MQRSAIALLLSGVLWGSLAAAQGANVALGGGGYDNSLPVEVSAEQLDINQTDGSARFTGDVVVGQGDLRLTGDVVDVEYSTAGDSRIQSLHARGNVTMATGVETAEAQEAVYTVDSGVVVMTGDVILTQGTNAMAGERLTVQLDSGTGVMEGRVRVIFGGGESQ